MKKFFLLLVLFLMVNTLFSSPNNDMQNKNYVYNDYQKENEKQFAPAFKDQQEFIDWFKEEFKPVQYKDIDFMYEEYIQSPVAQKGDGDYYGKSRYDSKRSINQAEWDAMQGNPYALREMNRKSEMKTILLVISGIGILVLLIFLLKPKGNSGIKFENQNN